MRRDTYWRKCRAWRVIDGDTVDVVIDLGFRMSMAGRIRLLGVNTPERKTTTRAAGDAAARYAADWLARASRGSTRDAERGRIEIVPGVGSEDYPLDIRTEKDDAFGRYLADLVAPDGSSLSAELLAAGQAVPYH